MFGRISRMMDRRGVVLGALYVLSKSGLPMRLAHRLAYGRRIAGAARIGRRSVILTRSLRMGSEISIGRGVSIIAESIRIEDGVTIADHVRIQCRELVLKRGSRIDARTVVHGVATPRSGFELGEQGWIYPDCYLNTDDRLTVGDRTAFGGYCLAFTHGSYLPITHGYPATFAPITIGADVWLPWHVFLLPGTVIGDGATIGAFSLVGGTVPANSLAVGVPAKVVKDETRYRRQYNDESLEKLCTEVVRNAADRWANGFRARSVFRPRRRQLVERGPAGIDLIDEHDTLSVRMIAGPDSTDRGSEPAGLTVSWGRLDAPTGAPHWIDLVTLQSHGLDDAGPIAAEFVQILTQFGIRFQWLPKSRVASRIALAVAEPLVPTR